MKKRTITAVFLLLVCIPILILSKYIVYPLFLSALSVVGLIELFRCIGLNKNYLLALPAYIIAGALPPVSYLLGVDNFFQLLTIILILYFLEILYYFTLAVFKHGSLRFAEVAEAFILTVYITISFTSLSIIRYVTHGVYCLWIAFIIAWSCDTFAYLFGSRFGKHKLIEAISPKKTVEGSVAGIVCATLAMLLYGLIIDLVCAEITPNYFVLAFMGFSLSIVSQIGDLVASLIKREHGVKDYGTVFPGHGGVMDRFDSILAVSCPTLLISLAFPPFV